MKILLITPPIIQLNGPYPATPYLTSYLRSKGFETNQKDMAIDLALKLFSPVGIDRIREKINLKKNYQHDVIPFFLDAYEDYRRTIGPVISFLQGKDQTLALRIAARNYLPEGPRFMPLDEYPEQLEGQFGLMGTHDKAKYIASLYLDDLADIIREGVDPDFGFSRYGEKLASSMNSFTPLYKRLQHKSLIDELIEELMADYINDFLPDVVGVTTPFPGNVLGALRIGQWLKQYHPKIKTVMGGGFVNTELRTLEDVRFFDFIDYLTFDDGERPLECLFEMLDGSRKDSELLRTWFSEDKKIKKVSSANEQDVSFKNLAAPTYDGLPLDRYISLLEMPNPMHRMWSDFRWNKMILAHGCYWKKCTFCDVSLDYIGRFEPQKASVVVDQLEAMIAETKWTGFHFVDEAAPPTLLKSMSEEILKRNLALSWWGNLRFDPHFNAEMAELMARAGCVAVTGGLEVASPRLLDKINKGISIEQTAQVTRHFVENGIFVHAYLMYGFPTQTTQETIDSLEVVRQLFLNECLHSAFWHRFSATPHSPVGMKPSEFGIKISSLQKPKEGFFAVNDLEFFDPTPTDHYMLGEGLKKAVYNFMHGIGLEEDVRAWFDEEVPRPMVSRNFIRSALKNKK